MHSIEVDKEQIYIQYWIVCFGFACRCCDFKKLLVQLVFNFRRILRGQRRRRSWFTRGSGPRRGTSRHRSADFKREPECPRWSESCVVFNISESEWWACPTLTVSSSCQVRRYLSLESLFSRISSLSRICRSIAIRRNVPYIIPRSGSMLGYSDLDYNMFWQCCGTRTAGTAIFFLSGIGTGIVMHSGAGSIIKCVIQKSKK